MRANTVHSQCVFISVFMQTITKLPIRRKSRARADRLVVVIDDVTYYVVLRIFNTNYWYSSASFTLKLWVYFVYDVAY